MVHVKIKEIKSRMHIFLQSADVEEMLREAVFYQFRQFGLLIFSASNTGEVRFLFSARIDF